jgi:hypothetical protein
MLIPLGFLASSGAAQGTFELIETTVLGTAASSVTFSGLATYAATYEHLQVRWVAKSTRAGNQTDMFWQANGDTTQANYRAHLLIGNGSTVASQDFGSASIYFGGIMNGLPASAYTNEFAVGVTDILDPYSTNKNKTVRTFRGVSATVNSAAGDLGLASGVYLSTSSLTSFTFKDRLANFSIGSRFSLYGIKGA